MKIIIVSKCLPYFVYRLISLWL